MLSGGLSEVLGRSLGGVDALWGASFSVVVIAFRKGKLSFPPPAL